MKQKTDYSMFETRKRGIGQWLIVAVAIGVIGLMLILGLTGCQGTGQGAGGRGPGLGSLQEMIWGREEPALPREVVRTVDADGTPVEVERPVANPLTEAQAEWIKSWSSR